MTRDGLSPRHGTAQDLGRLGDALCETGLGDYVANLDIFHPRYGTWADHRFSAPEDLRPLIDLFLLGRPVDRTALPPRLGHRVQALDGIGLFQLTRKDVALAGGLAIVPLLGRWLICQAPQAKPRFYLGDDTLALMARLTPRADGRCLDLCAGPGTLALHAAGIARDVIAVELAPDVAELARHNTHLNRVGHRIQVREGDLYGPVAGETFDCVLANPPMLPFPQDLVTSGVEDGGTDGFRLTRRILAGLPETLRPGGVAQVIGLSLSDGASPLGAGSLLAAAAGSLDLTVSVLSHVSTEDGTPYFDALVAKAALIAGTSTGTARRACRAHLDAAGAKGLCHLFIHARHRRASTGRLAVMDVSSTNRDSDWLWRRSALVKPTPKDRLGVPRGAETRSAREPRWTAC